MRQQRAPCPRAERILRCSAASETRTRLFVLRRATGDLPGLLQIMEALVLFSFSHPDRERNMSINLQ